MRLVGRKIVPLRVSTATDAPLEPLPHTGPPACVGQQRVRKPAWRRLAARMLACSPARLASGANFQ